MSTYLERSGKQWDYPRERLLESSKRLLAIRLECTCLLECFSAWLRSWR